MPLTIIDDKQPEGAPPPALDEAGIPTLDVLLISPPRFHELIGKNPAIVEKHRGFNPPLGVLSLAGYIEPNSKHRVQVIDAQPRKLDYDQLRSELQRHTFDVVGVTAMTFTLIDVIMTCRLVREVNPKATIVLGGPHVHLYPEESIRQPAVDFLIQGEGELAFVDFLNKLHRPDLWSSIAGIVYLDDDDNVVNGGIAPSAQDLDTLGFPARHKVDVGLYTSLLGKSDVITTMFTSRGCPYRCTFCDRPFSPVISGFRARSAAHVADEIEECLRLGITEAYIYDDTFSVKKERVYELCAEIKRRKLKFSWDVRAHVNTVTPDLLRAMKDAGCDRIHYGVESGNDRMLKTIKKNTTTKRIREVFGWTKAAGMETLAYFIIGQQTETRADIEDTIRLARELDPDYVHFTIFCPYPGTEIYQQGLDTGIIKEDVWRQLAEDPQPGFELPVWEENFSRAELRQMLVHCYKSFYLRPKYVMRRLSRIRSAGELKRKLKAGLSVVTMTPDQKVFEKEFRAKVRALNPRSPIDTHS